MKVTQSRKLMTMTSKCTTSPFQSLHNQTKELFRVVICDCICSVVIRIQGKVGGERDGGGKWRDQKAGGGEIS